MSEDGSVAASDRPGSIGESARRQLQVPDWLPGVLGHDVTIAVLVAAPAGSAPASGVLESPAIEGAVPADDPHAAAETGRSLDLLLGDGGIAPRAAVLPIVVGESPAPAVLARALSRSAAAGADIVATEAPVPADAALLRQLLAFADAEPLRVVVVPAPEDAAAADALPANLAAVGDATAGPRFFSAVDACPVVALAGALALTLSAARETHGDAVRPVDALAWLAATRDAETGFAAVGRAVERAQGEDPAAIRDPAQHDVPPPARDADAAGPARVFARPPEVASRQPSPPPADAGEPPRSPVDAEPKVGDADTGDADTGNDAESRLDVPRAARLEQEFLAGFEARVFTLDAVANPMEGGKTYTIRPNNERVSFFSERDQLKHLIIRHKPRLGDIRKYPANRGVAISLMRRRMFSPMMPRVVFIGACVTPLDELVTAGHATSPATRRRINDFLETRITEPDAFHFVGIFSTTGWSEDAIASVPTGANLRLFLVDCSNETGFRVHAAANLDGKVRNAFDPEDDAAKLQRAARFLRTAAVLKTAGGFLLLDEIAERCNVPNQLVVKACESAMRDNPELRLERVDQTFVIRRPRF
jgi:hypothetical protein